MARPGTGLITLGNSKVWSSHLIKVLGWTGSTLYPSEKDVFVRSKSCLSKGIQACTAYENLLILQLDGMESFLGTVRKAYRLPESGRRTMQERFYMMPGSLWEMLKI